MQTFSTWGVRPWWNAVKWWWNRGDYRVALASYWGEGSGIPQIGGTGDEACQGRRERRQFRPLTPASFPRLGVSRAGE